MAAGPPAGRCAPYARCVTGSGRGSRPATVRSRIAQCYLLTGLSVNGSFTRLKVRHSEKSAANLVTLSERKWRGANTRPNAEIMGYYSFCDLHVQLSMADKIGFVDFLTYSRYVPGVTRGRLPSSRFTGSTVPAYFGAIKRIVVTTHRQGADQRHVCAARPRDSRARRACATACAPWLHGHWPVSRSYAEARGERPLEVLSGASGLVRDEQNLAGCRERTVFCQKPCTRSLGCNTVTESICWLAHARVQPCNVGARDPLPGVRDGISTGRTTHGR